ncbi:general secretion pathway protein GspK [Pseudomonas sp. MAFF212428]|uniref:General secretion pathway protein GspK n=1 Tax=Pseudomonas brassicae TaxID=2708063 RepID=A0A6M0CX16_9PSED|nr:general secretion pathway protein GspK [Pseudomonas brassicae]
MWWPACAWRIARATTSWSAARPSWQPRAARAGGATAARRARALARRRAAAGVRPGRYPPDPERAQRAWQARPQFLPTRTLRQATDPPGRDPQRAALHARQLQQHRTQGKPLRHLEELLQVTTLTTEHYQRVLPFITLWGGDGVPVAAYAAPTLRKALGLKAASAVVSNPGSMLSIDSQAELGNGTTAGVLTTVVLNPGDGDGTLYRVLRWQER